MPSIGGNRYEQKNPKRRGILAKYPANMPIPTENKYVMKTEESSGVMTRMSLNSLLKEY